MSDQQHPARQTGIEAADDSPAGRDGQSDTASTTILQLDTEATELGRLEPFDCDDVAVRTARSVETAWNSLRTEPVDCVVAEYDLDGTTGLEFLDRIRADDHTVPFVLFTGRDPASFSRDIASADVSALVEKGGTDQYERLADVVARVSDGSRRSQWFEGGVEQLRELFSTLPTGSELHFWDWDLRTGTVSRSHRTDPVVGQAAAEAQQGLDSILERVHPDHRGKVESTVEQALETRSCYRVQYTLDTPGPQSWWVEDCGAVLATNGTPVRVVGLSRDITRQKTGDRGLYHEQYLNRTLREALVESDTRGDIESVVVDRLAEYGYDLAWIGDWVPGGLKPRAVAGDTQCTDELGLESSLDIGVERPSVVAARTGTPEFVTGEGDGLGTDWDEPVAECSYRSTAAVPLTYNDVLYGVLTICDSAPDPFNETGRQQLVDLADTLAVIIHNVEAENAFGASKVINAKVQTVRTDYYLRDVLRGADCDTTDVRLKITETIPRGEKQIQYLSVNGAGTDTIGDEIRAHPTVEEVTTIADDTDPRLQVIHTAETPEGTLAEFGTAVQSTSVTRDRTDILIETPNRKVLQDSLEALKTTHDQVSVLSCTERERQRESHGDVHFSELTERQIIVLRAAYQQGYFEQPRDASATEVAESLDISHPTLLEHLRRAQDKIFESHFT